MNDTATDQATDMDPNPDRLDFLPIDPFAAKRDIASRIKGLGGKHPGDDPAYVFQSLDLYPALGPVHFTLHFHQLVATTGTLIVTIRATSAYPGTLPMVVRTMTADMADIAAAGGILDVPLTSRRNMIYTVGGTIDDDTDACAQAMSLSLYPRERDVPEPEPTPDTMSIEPPLAPPVVTPVTRLLHRPELVTTRPSSLSRPVSQAMTTAQSRDLLVDAWNDMLHRSGGTEVERWEEAFILQALEYYGVTTDRGAALGIGGIWGGMRRSLPCYLAGRGCTVLMAATRCDDLSDGDPGLMLEHLLDEGLCPPGRFFEAVHLTLFDDLTVPAGLTGFDFLWSTNVSVNPDARSQFPRLLRDSIACLRPGGVAIHLLRYSGRIGTRGDGGSDAYGRAEIERMALSLIADGHEVAQLKFDIDHPDMPGDQEIPFALIARRMR